MRKNINSMNKLVISNIRGGLGNQLFQYATGLRIAKNNNATFKQDLSFFNIAKYKNSYRLDRFNCPINRATDKEIQCLKNVKASLSFKVYKKLKIHRFMNSKYRKRTHIFDSNGHQPKKEILNAKAPVYVEGWCFKLEYFSDIRHDLLYYFKPKVKLSNYSKKIINLIKHNLSVSLHVRRGDYVKNDYFHNLTINYYLNSIRYFEKRLKNPIFIVFSDDIEWVKNSFKSFNQSNIFYVNHADKKKDIDILDFHMMSICKHNIIANSSFSWWSAYLNKNENNVTIYPAVWYDEKKVQNSYVRHASMPTNWIKMGE